MATRNCYHYDLSETGVCPKCATFVQIETGTRVDVSLGFSEKVSGSFDQPTADPYLRDALGLVLGIAAEDVWLVDVRPSGERRWENKVTVTFRIIGSKVDLTASVGMVPTTMKTPDSGEYDDAEIAAEVTQ